MHTQLSFKPQTITSSGATLNFRPDGLLDVSIDHGYHFTYKDAKELFSIVNKVAGEPVPTLVDHRTPHSLSFRARLCISNAPELAALAVLVNPGINAEIADLVIRVIGTKYPSRLFYEREPALTWLAGFLY